MIMNDKISCARSNSDGITYYSNTIPFTGIESKITSNGKYVVKPVFTMLEDVLGFLEGKGLVKYVIDSKSAFLLNIFLVMISIYADNLYMLMGTIYLTLTVGKLLYQFIIFSTVIKLGSERRLGRFHSAEHMSVKAYNELGRIPTLEELKKYSRFSDKCGSRIIIRQVVFGIIITLDIMFVVKINLSLCFLVMLIAAILVKLDEKYGILIFLQFFFTNKPTDTELFIAIKGLEGLELFEKCIESDNVERFEEYFSCEERTLFK